LLFAVFLLWLAGSINEHLDLLNFHRRLLILLLFVFRSFFNLFSFGLSVSWLNLRLDLGGKRVFLLVDPDSHLRS
jgi:hypothetical protein